MWRAAGAAISAWVVGRAGLVDRLLCHSVSLRLWSHRGALRDSLSKAASVRRIPSRLHEKVWTTTIKPWIETVKGKYTDRIRIFGVEAAEKM